MQLSNNIQLAVHVSNDYNNLHNAAKHLRDAIVKFNSSLFEGSLTPEEKNIVVEAENIAARILSRTTHHSIIEYLKTL